MDLRVALLLGALPFAAVGSAHAADSPWLAGFSKVDVTPGEPVRMAGYGNRNHPSEGIDTPLFVRCFALQANASPDAKPAIVLSVDSIGLPGAMTRELASSIEKKHGIARAQVAVCSTHTHCGPDLVSELSNIFAEPLSDEETAAGKRYRQQLIDGILKAVDDAIAGLRPAKLAYEVGQATFAANRRVLKDGRWSGFGVQPDGPVDHTVPVLRIADVDDKVLGVVFNYACHCTTLGGEHYQINSEWAGYACENLETNFPGAVALCTIGCGADANPNPRGTLDAAKVHGRTLGAEVARVAGAEMATIDQPLDARFDYAALSFDLPTKEELERRAQDANPQTKRHAEQLLDLLRREGRLPATYPVPIQSWQFGDQLTMVFLGGEVVVDYALRLKKTLDDPKLWVTAYANDVLGYIASERMRTEGGYEYDRSGVFYGLPGPWAAGTEELLIRRVTELLTTRGRSQPLSPDDALKAFQIPAGFKIDLVAAEPLVEDPINLAFGADGRLWVVEMGDYPEGENGGRVKVLVDANGDGVYDQASTFMTGLAFPTGAMPWRDGVLISAAPDILFAKDTDGDGRADDIQKLYTGFGLANPQHRINGFSYGLDHSLHLASGDNLGEIQSVKTGQKVNASGHDVQIWPDEGRLAVTSGRTQYIRSRNDWGQWFGNDNSRPMYHFPIDDRYLVRNAAIAYPASLQQLFTPAAAPPVYPLTSASERFNDLFAANRFTSACSSIVARSPMFRSGEQDVVIVCEPVHNLVHLSRLEPSGASYQAVRPDELSSSEFLASRDPWFRPVRASIGPDGALYVVDMYRETIEHPQWIPQAWQQQLDLRAGADRGRIYRIAANAASQLGPVDLASLSTPDLVAQLQSPIGSRRDLAQQLILEREDANSVARLKAIAQPSSPPHARAHALAILQSMKQLDLELLTAALEDTHPGLLLVAIELAEKRLGTEPALIESLSKTAQHADPRVVLQTALTLGESRSPAAGLALASIASDPHLDLWTARAVSSSAVHHAGQILSHLLPSIQASASANIHAQTLLTDLITTLQSSDFDVISEYRGLFANKDANVVAQVRLASCFASAFSSKNKQAVDLSPLLGPVYSRAIDLLRDPQQDVQHRCEAMSLVGIRLDSEEREQALLIDLIHPSTPTLIQQQAIDRLTRFSSPEVCDAVIDRWGSMSQSIRDHSIARMLERPAWTEKLLDALEANAIDVRSLQASARQQLARSGSRSMRVRAERLMRTAGSPQKQTLVDRYLSEMSGPGDAAAGEVRFKQHCAVCHASAGQNAAIGASLENLTDRSNEGLTTAILDPNRAVDPKYFTYLVQLDDDRVLAGVIEDESGSGITLAHADGKRTTIRRDRVVEMKNSGVSLMPEGFEAMLPPSHLRDVLAYLQSNATPSPLSVSP
ncbi:MAG: neutral/alkaline non-lysosomal ceramidase N-terminal domain-containing protein [Planctomycetaceae bacterium]